MWRGRSLWDTRLTAKTVHIAVWMELKSVRKLGARRGKWLVTWPWLLHIRPIILTSGTHIPTTRHAQRRSWGVRVFLFTTVLWLCGIYHIPHRHNACHWHHPLRMWNVNFWSNVFSVRQALQSRLYDKSLLTSSVHFPVLLTCWTDNPTLTEVESSF